ncbi:MAG: DUF6318 family protein [Nocardioides sp.]
MKSRAAALTAALLLTLTACGGGDSVAEARPDYANQPGRDGAEKFAGYWVDEINQASASGKTESLKDLGLPECDTCTDFANHLDEVYSGGGHVESDDWTLKSVIPEHGATDEQVGMLLTVTVPPNKVYSSEDAKAQSFPGGDQRFRMIVVRKDDHWMIKDLEPR